MCYECCSSMVKLYSIGAEAVLINLQERDILHKMGSLQSNDVDMNKCYQKLFLLWADNGVFDSIQEVAEIKSSNESFIWLSKVIALINR